MLHSSPADDLTRTPLNAFDAMATYGVVDRDGLLVEVNDLFCQLSGRSRSALVGTSYRDLMVTEAAPEALAAMRAALACGEPWRGEVPVAATGGAAIWLDTIATPQRDFTGDIIGFTAVGLDVTARRRTEEALRESEALLRSTLTALSEGIVVEDVEGRIVSFNPAAERLLQMMGLWSPGGAAADGPRCRIIHEDGSAFAASEHPARRAIADGQPQHQVIMGLQSDHRPTTWLSVNAQPIFGGRGAEPTAAVTSYSDITARKLAQETLNEAVAAMPDGFVVYDSVDRLVLCNEAYRDMYKPSAPAIQPGASFRDILIYGLHNGQYPEAGSSAAEHEAWLDERMRRHSAASNQVIQQLPDGRWLQIRERRTPSGYIVGFRTDVTDLKREIAKVRAILDNFPAGISFVDRDLNLAACNDRFRRLLDLPDPLFANGMPTLEMVFRFNAARGEYGPGDPEEQVQSRLAVARKATAHVFERTRPDGTVIEIRGTPIQGGGFITTYTDVTERHVAQTRLAESEQQARAQSESLQLTLANMSQGLGMFDARGALMVWNRRFIDLYRLPPDEVKEGTDFRDLVAMRHRCGTLNVGSEVAPYADQVLQGLASAGVTREISRLADGRVIRIVRTAVHGGWLGTHEDITDMERAEAAVRDKAAELARINMRFEAALTHMSQGICLFDANRTLVICNQRFRDMYNFTPEQVGPGTSLETILRLLAANGETSKQPIKELLQTLPGKLEEILRLADGRVVAIRRRPTPDGGWVATHEDITDKERAAQKISHLAYHDVLTGLANRAQFKKEGEAALAKTAEMGGAIGVFLVDLDRFKAVNDTFGHAAGDAVLLAATDRMRQSVSSGDIIARLGGDEFAIIQHPAPDQREAAVSLAATLVDVLGAPFDVDGNQAMIGASVGIAIQSGRDDTIEQLMHKADLALYRVKAAGRNGYRFYEEDLASAEQDRIILGRELRDALSSGALEVRYEPVVSLPGQRTCGMEARIFWAHPERGLLDAKVFSAVAEEVGLTIPLGELLLRRACNDAGRWPEHVKLIVNVARIHVKKRTLMDTVTEALLRARMAPERLNVAISETALLHDDPDVLAELHQLRSLGISIVLDGYGVGHSSLNHLRSFPFDGIKIDGSMVVEITSRPESAAIVCAVTGLARSLDILTTAEGVSSEEQLRMLQAAGCSQVQGGLFGSAASATETLSRLLIENALPDQAGVAEKARGRSAS